MKISEKIHHPALETIVTESKVAEALKNSVNQDFIDAAKIIYKTPSHMIITSIGKSVPITSKIVVTLDSTRTSAIFMHATDAVHGNLRILGVSKHKKGNKK